MQPMRVTREDRAASDTRSNLFALIKARSFSRGESASNRAFMAMVSITREG